MVLIGLSTVYFFVRDGSFLQMEKVGSQNCSLFVAVINVRPLNGLKLQPIQSLEAAVSSSTSSHKSDTFLLHREQPPAPPLPITPLPTPLMIKPKHLLLLVHT